MDIIVARVAIAIKHFEVGPKTMAKILIVEDDPHLSSLIRNLLIAERHQTEMATNGNDALGMLKAWLEILYVKSIETAAGQRPF